MGQLQIQSIMLFFKLPAVLCEFLSKINDEDIFASQCYDRSSDLIKMSEEQLMVFLEKVKGDASLQERLKAAKSSQEVAAIAKENGCIFPAESIVNSINIQLKKKHLSDIELESLSGGEKCCGRTISIE